MPSALSVLPSAAASLLAVASALGGLGREPLCKARADGDEAEPEAVRCRSACSIHGNRPWAGA